MAMARGNILRLVGLGWYLICTYVNTRIRIHFNLLNKHLKRHTLICTSYQKYLLSVLVYTSQGLSEVYVRTLYYVLTKQVVHTESVQFPYVTSSNSAYCKPENINGEFMIYTRKLVGYSSCSTNHWMYLLILNI